MYYYSFPHIRTSTNDYNYYSYMANTLRYAKQSSIFTTAIEHEKLYKYNSSDVERSQIILNAMSLPIIIDNVCCLMLLNGTDCRCN